jgi:iron complex transport system ATP-binding protein
VPDSIELHNIGVLRGRRWLLRAIDWRIPAGSCAAIIGPNGSGKSTLARILAAHLWPTEGDVCILGQRFGDADLPALRKAIRLLQPAGPYDVDPSLTASQVVLSGFFGTLALYDSVNQHMQREARRALDQVGLDAAADQPYSTLSSGERIRALIARALVQKPKLLLLDEPTAGLDLLAREQVLATVQRMFDNGQPRMHMRGFPTTVVIITHHIEELPPATSNVLVLCEGRCAAQGPPTEVVNERILSAAYKCPVQVRRSNGRFYLEVHPAGWDKLLGSGKRR